MDKSFGIALSGGGAKCAAHIGVLHALNDNGSFPTEISGASAGSIIGSLYCNSYSLKEILQLAKTHEFLKIFKFGIIDKGFTELGYLENF